MKKKMMKYIDDEDGEDDDEDGEHDEDHQDDDEDNAIAQRVARAGPLSDP